MDFDKSIQFLVCPQVDFIGRLHCGGQPSHKLHVGASALRRLRGDRLPGSPDPYVDTVQALMAVDDPPCHLVLDEDWHPASCEEFPVFGPHCVKGSPGARLVGALEELRWHRRTHVLRANSLNVAASPRYADLLSEVVGATRPERVRVGVFGVWTHVKVEYLLLNLTTLPPRFTQVAVCGPLCASPRRDDHIYALRKLRALGYRVFDEIPDYLRWMGRKPVPQPTGRRWR